MHFPLLGSQNCPEAQVTPAHGVAKQPATHLPPTQVWPLPQVTPAHGSVVLTQVAVQVEPPPQASALPALPAQGSGWQIPPRQTSPVAQVDAQPPELPPPLEDAPPEPLLAPPVPTLAPPSPLLPPLPEPTLPPLPEPTLPPAPDPTLPPLPDPLPPLPESVLELPPVPLCDCDAEFPQPSSIELRMIAEAMAPARSPVCVRSATDGSRFALSVFMMGASDPI